MHIDHHSSRTVTATGGITPSRRVSALRHRWRRKWRHTSLEAQSCCICWSRRATGGNKWNGEGFVVMAWSWWLDRDNKLHLRLKFFILGALVDSSWINWWWMGDARKCWWIKPDKDLLVRGRAWQWLIWPGGQVNPRVHECWWMLCQIMMRSHY